MVEKRLALYLFVERGGWVITCENGIVPGTQRSVIPFNGFLFFYYQALLSIFFFNILPALDDYILSPYEYPRALRMKTRRIWVPRYSYSYRKEATTLSQIFFTRRGTLGRKRTKKNGPATPLTQELSANLRMLTAGGAWRRTAQKGQAKRFARREELLFFHILCECEACVECEGSE